uniref:Protein kinase domain-containing protein n=1 Tax=Chromera velia CCMP2878 TaxID=1169474 RepID=A0A0G4G0R0_9ALVE|eukprot:Cvel_4011.t1-p1 / transcript=Cvel_4011.t1 / gene=Cvel_4011 / organism=Chromera_velia_CCMP2878 / gene_product=Calcium-dependent protein kinase 16, putative / transcript_product=Calcium-dependent protein kinase 16, putative / location=Cvel_scaffold170:97278-107800(-) / protein_length=1992 / sequence_SO=supercontig / SO=protein_coding / is_pseudo=false
MLRQERNLRRFLPEGKEAHQFTFTHKDPTDLVDAQYRRKDGGLAKIPLPDDPDPGFFDTLEPCIPCAGRGRIDIHDVAHKHRGVMRAAETVGEAMVMMKDFEKELSHAHQMELEKSQKKKHPWTDFMWLRDVMGVNRLERTRGRKEIVKGYEDRLPNLVDFEVHLNKRTVVGSVNEHAHAKVLMGPARPSKAEFPAPACEFFIIYSKEEHDEAELNERLQNFVDDDACSVTPATSEDDDVHPQSRRKDEDPKLNNNAEFEKEKNDKRKRTPIDPAGDFSLELDENLRPFIEHQRRIKAEEERRKERKVGGRFLTEKEKRRLRRRRRKRQAIAADPRRNLSSSSSPTSSAREEDADEENLRPQQIIARARLAEQMIAEGLIKGGSQRRPPDSKQKGPSSLRDTQGLAASVANANPVPSAAPSNDRTPFPEAAQQSFGDPDEPPSGPDEVESAPSTVKYLGQRAPPPSERDPDRDLLPSSVSVQSARSAGAKLHGSSLPSSSIYPHGGPLSTSSDPVSYRLQGHHELSLTAEDDTHTRDHPRSVFDPPLQRDLKASANLSSSHPPRVIEEQREKAPKLNKSSPAGRGIDPPLFAPSAAAPVALVDAQKKQRDTPKPVVQLHAAGNLSDREEDSSDNEPFKSPREVADPAESSFSSADQCFSLPPKEEKGDARDPADPHSSPAAAKSDPLVPPLPASNSDPAAASSIPSPVSNENATAKDGAVKSDPEVTPRREGGNQERRQSQSDSSSSHKEDSLSLLSPPPKSVHPQNNQEEQGMDPTSNLSPACPQPPPFAELSSPPEGQGEANGLNGPEAPRETDPSTALHLPNSPPPVAAPAGDSPCSSVESEENSGELDSPRKTLLLGSKGSRRTSMLGSNAAFFLGSFTGSLQDSQLSVASVGDSPANLPEDLLGDFDELLGSRLIEAEIFEVDVDDLWPPGQQTCSPLNKEGALVCALRFAGGGHFQRTDWVGSHFQKRLAELSWIGRSEVEKDKTDEIVVNVGKPKARIMPEKKKDEKGNDKKKQEPLPPMPLEELLSYARACENGQVQKLLKLARGTDLRCDRRFEEKELLIKTARRHEVVFKKFVNVLAQRYFPEHVGWSFVGDVVKFARHNRMAYPYPHASFRQWSATPEWAFHRPYRAVNPCVETETQEAKSRVKKSAEKEDKEIERKQKKAEEKRTEEMHARMRGLPAGTKSPTPIALLYKLDYQIMKPGGIVHPAECLNPPPPEPENPAPVLALEDFLSAPAPAEAQKKSEETAGDRGTLEIRHSSDKTYVTVEEGRGSTGSAVGWVDLQEPQMGEMEEPSDATSSSSSHSSSDSLGSSSEGGSRRSSGLVGERSPPVSFSPHPPIESPVQIRPELRDMGLNLAPPSLFAKQKEMDGKVGVRYEQSSDPRGVYSSTAPGSPQVSPTSALKSPGRSPSPRRMRSVLFASKRQEHEYEETLEERKEKQTRGGGGGRTNRSASNLWQTAASLAFHSAIEEEPTNIPTNSQIEKTVKRRRVKRIFYQPFDDPFGNRYMFWIHLDHKGRDQLDGEARQKWIQRREMSTGEKWIEITEEELTEIYANALMRRKERMRSRLASSPRAEGCEVFRRRCIRRRDLKQMEIFFLPVTEEGLRTNPLLGPQYGMTMRECFWLRKLHDMYDDTHTESIIEQAACWDAFDKDWDSCEKRCPPGLYYVRERMKGPFLDRVIEARPVDYDGPNMQIESEVAIFIKQMLDALVHLRRIRLLHRGLWLDSFQFQELPGKDFMLKLVHLHTVIQVDLPTWLPEREPYTYDESGKNPKRKIPKQNLTFTWRGKRGTYFQRKQKLHRIYENPTSRMCFFDHELWNDEDYHFNSELPMHHWAPENFHGKALPSSDVWSIGVMAYYMITRQMPFGDEMEDPLTLYTRVQKGASYMAESKRGLQYWRNMTTPVQDFIEKCLDPDPFTRWSAEDAASHEWLNSPFLDMYAPDLTVKYRHLFPLFYGNEYFDSYMIKDMTNRHSGQYICGPVDYH